MSGDVLRGRIWVLKDSGGRLIEDIDTDQIFHNAHLHITDPARMGQFALGNLDGWKDFPEKAGRGDILIAGRNFGAGSSRQQAVDCFMALGVAALVAPSFGAIYFRNAVNSGFPVLRSGVVTDLVLKQNLNSGDRIELDLARGEARILIRDMKFSFSPMSEVQRAVYASGGLFAYARTLDGASD